ncbi:MAG: hypothetical protein C0423_16490 [Methylibium sp.]|nr:hypothetical protein [Methylibium sp.]
MLRALKGPGTTGTFGAPVDFGLPLVQSIEKAGIQTLQAFSQEPALGIAAEAAARVGNAPGFCVD